MATSKYTKLGLEYHEIVKALTVLGTAPIKDKWCLIWFNKHNKDNWNYGHKSVYTIPAISCIKDTLDAPTFSSPVFAYYVDSTEQDYLESIVSQETFEMQYLAWKMK